MRPRGAVGAVIEATFQGEVRLAATRELHDVVGLWRQPAGKVLAKRGGAVSCAPVGAADLSGIVKATGVRVELELKMPGKKRSEEQVTWAENLRAWGAVYVLATYDKKLTLDANVAATLAALRAAIDARAREPRYPGAP